MTKRVWFGRETGSIADRDWFAEALLGCRTRPLESVPRTRRPRARRRAVFPSEVAPLRSIFATRDRRATDINGCCHGLKSINGCSMVSETMHRTTVADEEEPTPLDREQVISPIGRHTKQLAELARDQGCTTLCYLRGILTLLSVSSRCRPGFDLVSLVSNRGLHRRGLLAGGRRASRALRRER
jgi:hypothetical protein